MEKRQLAKNLRKIARVIEACGGSCGCAPEIQEAIPLPAAPLPVQPAITHAAPEDDQEILELRNLVSNILTNYQIPLNQGLVNDLVGLIEQHEIKEFPEHAAIEPASHLQGLTSANI